jgi:hypothetical protein
MRQRASHLWAAVGVFALVALLALAWHPGFGAEFAAGMSVPSTPRTSIESAPVDKLLQSHFDGCVPDRRTADIGRAPASFLPVDGARQNSRATQHYGPLHRRPPPSLS